MFISTFSRVSAVYACAVASATLSGSAPAEVPSSSAVRVLYVDSVAGAGGDGAGWQTAFRDLSDALTEAAAEPGKSVEIRVAGGIYKPVTAWGTASTFEIPGGVTLIGAYGGLRATQPGARDVGQFATLLSGDILGNDGDGFDDSARADNAFHVITVEGSSLPVVIDGFTISGGADDGRAGGGAFIRDADATIRNCTFIRNCADCWGLSGRRSAALHEPEGGGAVFAESRQPGHRIVMDNCDFALNATIGSGGAVSTLRVSVSIERCRFHDNYGSYGGAVAIWNAPESVVVDCEFLHNAAKFGGGVAVYSTQSAKVQDSAFIGNTAESDGGAIYEEYTSLEIGGADFVGNMAGENGGAVSAYFGSSLVVSMSRFAGNSAADGGAIKALGHAIRCVGSVFESNSGRGRGGAIFAPLSGHASVATYGDCEFNGNHAGTDGGAVCGFYRSDFRDCAFKANNAQRGGAVYGEWGESDFRRCLFRGNRAQASGGAIRVSNSAVGRTAIEAVSCLFVDNAAKDGAAISKGYGSGLAQACTAAGNTNWQSSGAIAGTGFTIENSILWKNRLVAATGISETAQDQISSAGNVQIRNSNVQGWTRVDEPTVTSGDPMFLEPFRVPRWGLLLAPDTLALHPLSPCRDSGSLQYVAEAGDADIEGKPRILCGQVDRGAYEYGTVGDANCDGVVGLSDLVEGTACMTGPGWSAGLPACQTFDADLDGGIDLRDLAWLFPRCSPRAAPVSE